MTLRAANVRGAPFRTALRAAALSILLPLVTLLHATILLVLLAPAAADALAPGDAPLTLLDRHGDLLAIVPTAGNTGATTHLADVPAIAIAAIVEAEDERFFTHRGVDALGLARAAWLDLRGGHLGYGGSTLTMQLARMLLDDQARTPAAKLREAVLALRLERTFDKRAILEAWLGRACFGNGAYGLAAAADLYFGKPAATLSPGEATLLAVLPRAPVAYDPLRHLDRALARRDHVLDLLVARGVLADADAAAIRAEPLAPTRHAPPTQAPHFVRWLLDELPPEVRGRGGVVHTTLDLRLGRVLEARVAAQVAQGKDAHLAQAGLVVLDTQAGEVRALIGSVGWDRPDGEIDIATRRRHPGSALKPFVYAAAIEAGASPTTIAWDTRDTSAAYAAPSSPEHGPVRYRQALASSFNFAAINVLETVGVARVATLLRQAGVAPLPGAADDYGLRLALGAAKVRLLDLTAGYGFLVRGGKVGRPRGVAWIDLPQGGRWLPPREPDRQIFSPTTAWLTMDMLADPDARRPGFGMELPLDLPFPVAAKTGTARGFADTWTVAATREYLVGAWAGTFDGTPTAGLVGMDAAAPLVRAALLAFADGHPLTLPTQPDDVDDVEVCAISGDRPGPHCPRIHDHVAHGHGPTTTCAWHRDDGGLTYPARAKGWLARRR